MITKQVSVDWELVISSEDAPSSRMKQSRKRIWGGKDDLAGLLKDTAIHFLSAGNSNGIHLIPLSLATLQFSQMTVGIVVVVLFFFEILFI